MSRNIYFAGSMRAGRQDQALYHQIIELLKSHGQVMTEFVGFGGSGESGLLTDHQIHEKDVKMLQQCGCVVAEVTTPSLGVGYEIGRAVAMGKKIICLYRQPDAKHALSAMLAGCEDGENFIVKNYTCYDDVPAILTEFFSNH